METPFSSPYPVKSRLWALQISPISWIDWDWAITFVPLQNLGTENTINFSILLELDLFPVEIVGAVIITVMDQVLFSSCLEGGKAAQREN